MQLNRRTRAGCRIREQSCRPQRCTDNKQKKAGRFLRPARNCYASTRLCVLDVLCFRVVPILAGVESAADIREFSDDVLSAITETIAQCQR